MSALAEEIVELTAFNRSFWCNCRDKVRCSHHSPMTDDDVWLLLGQGYGLTDIAIMFGLSKERVRQVANRVGVPRTPGTKRRIWDESLGRFRAYEHKEWHTRVRLQRRAKRRRATQEGQEQRRQRQVQAVRDLFKELGRSPTTREVADRCGVHKIRLYIDWGYNYRRKVSGSSKAASAALYRAAGLIKRGVGGAGHTSPYLHSIRRCSTKEAKAIWLSPHPYGTGSKLGIGDTAVWNIIHSKTYRDVTSDLPPRSHD